MNTRHPSHTSSVALSYDISKYYLPHKSRAQHFLVRFILAKVLVNRQAQIPANLHVVLRAEMCRFRVVLSVGTNLRANG